MTPIKRRLLYIFRGDLLRLRITWSKAQMLTLSIGYKVDREDSRGRPKWDGRRCRPGTTHGNQKIPALVINRQLQFLEDKIEEAFYSFEIANKVPTPKDIKTALNIGNKSDETESVQSLMLKFAMEGESNRQWAENTTKSVLQLRKLLSKFRPKLNVCDLNAKLIEDFTAYQTTHRLTPERYKFASKGYSNAVIVKHNNIFKWFLKWAASKGYISHDIISEMKQSVKTIKKSVIFLSVDELLKVYNWEFEKGSEIDKARDVFCLCCFTSLRYSDVTALRKSAVKNNYIEVVTIKTGTSVKIDLNNYSKAILTKYAAMDGDEAMPQFTNHRLNELVKSIGRICNIDEEVTVSQFYGAKRIDKTVPKYKLLSSHCGRRTFICFALSLGIPPNIVMKWTGHTDYASMKPYIDIMDVERTSAMAKFNLKDGLSQNGTKSGTE